MKEEIKLLVVLAQERRHIVDTMKDGACPFPSVPSCALDLGAPPASCPACYFGGRSPDLRAVSRALFTAAMSLVSRPGFCAASSLTLAGGTSIAPASDCGAADVQGRRD